MPDTREYKQLTVQPMPDAGLIVKFKSSRVHRSDQVNEAREELLSLVAPERLLLFDFTNVEYLSSAVIGALVGAQRELKKRAGNISICGLHSQFEELFKVLRLDRSFEIYPDLETALGSSNSNDQ
jgi:anti-sigma B factor antagonist